MLSETGRAVIEHVHVGTPSWRLTMRKQDRVAAQQQGSGEPSHQTQKPDRPQSEQMKGSASTNQPGKPQRQGGKLPLPD